MVAPAVCSCERASKSNGDARTLCFSLKSPHLFISEVQGFWVVAWCAGCSLSVPGFCHLLVAFLGALWPLSSLCNTMQFWCGCFLCGTCPSVPRALLCSLRSCCSLARLSSGGVCHFKGPVCFCGHGLGGARRMCCGGCLLAHGSSSNSVAPLRWPLSPPVCSCLRLFLLAVPPGEGRVALLVRFVACSPPPPCCCVAGCLPLRRNGRPEVRLRWSAPGSCSPLGRPPLFWGAVSHSLAHLFVTTESHTY